jgi:hypothetical protein
MENKPSEKLFPGTNFTKNELKLRLNEMGVEFDINCQKKNYFVELYDEAIKLEENQEKIRSRIIKDTQDYNETRQKRLRANLDESISGEGNSSIISRVEKIEDQQQSIKDRLLSKYFFTYFINSAIKTANIRYHRAAIHPN